jgi:hypothetical protein
MYTTRDSNFEAPALDARIWRYSNLAKFIRVLQQRALFFSSAAILTDIYEGNLTRPSLQRWLTVSNAPERVASDAAASFVRGMIAINSWHESEHESAAMWLLYSRDDQGIAIQSTFGRLVNSLEQCGHNVWIGKVRYIGYTQHDFSDVDIRDIKQWFAHKRREFAYEKELRAMTVINPGESGKEVLCDLRVLIESIRIAPAAPRYMVDLVTDLCRRFDIDVDVKPSNLDDPPPLRKAIEAN